jgi:hypothetical protein
MSSNQGVQFETFNFNFFLILNWLVGGNWGIRLLIASRIFVGSSPLTNVAFYISGNTNGQSVVDILVYNSTSDSNANPGIILIILSWVLRWCPSIGNSLFFFHKFLSQMWWTHNNRRSSLKIIKSSLILCINSNTKLVLERTKGNLKKKYKSKRINYYSRFKLKSDN